MARKKWKEPKHKLNGTVYVLRMELESRIVFKVGATSRSAKIRCQEILGEIYDYYGYFPKTIIVKQQTCKNYYKVEAAIHARLKSKQYRLKAEFSGSSEIFEVGIGELEHVYIDEINKDYPVD